jgi:hypothetical protein
MNDKFNLEDYVDVNERVKQFWKAYPKGRINTALEHIDGPESSNRLVVIHAEVFADRELGSPPIATGYAKEREGTGYVNKTSFLENCETSAIGRALANLGFGVEKSRPSREEMESVQRQEEEHQKVLEAIKIIAKDGSVEQKSTTKQMWVKLKEDPQAALKYLHELETTVVEA